MKKIDVIITLSIFFAMSGAVSMVTTWLSTISPWLSLGAIVLMGVVAMVCALINEKRDGTE